MAMTIRSWLEGLGLAQYVEAFEANDIDPDLVEHLTDSVLKDIGVASAGHRLRILNKVALFSAAQHSPTAAPKVTVEAAHSDAGERRQATILIADICDYTALCGRLDAEQVQALLAQFYEVADRIVSDYGGYVVDHAGDGLFASFGAPVAHGNDSERAARAAFEMHEKAAPLGGQTIPRVAPLALHIGIASGEVVAATIQAGAHPRYAITGETVNLAARLNALAQAGQTLVTAEVWRAVSRTVSAESLGEVAVKGFARPVALWRLGAIRRADAQRRPLIGRQAELRQMIGVLDSVLETRSGLAIRLRGEAGIGKSKLTDELRHHAHDRGYACHSGFVLDFGVGKSQDALPSISRDLLELSAQATETEVRRAVQDALDAGLVVEDQVVLLEDLLELTLSAARRGQFDAMDSVTRMQRASEMVVGMLHRAALQRPRLIVVEDIHWASPDLIRHLAAITRGLRHSRLVLVMTTRFEGDPLDQPWIESTQGSPLLTLDLGPLGQEESLLLADNLATTSNELIRQCIARAEGNPLFLEQLLRDAAENRPATVPGSIQSLVLSRIDRLEPRDKRALQAASVLGKRFSLQSLRTLAADPQYDCATLISSDLVRTAGPDFIFAHALIQEGVYSSLLHTRKRELHRLAADGVGEHEPIVRAEHLDRASHGDAALAYLAAARDQASRFRHESASRLAERGIELARDDAVRCDLLLISGDLLRETGRSGDSLQAFSSALQCASTDDQRLRAHMGIVAGHRITTDIPAAMAALDQAQQIAERIGHPDQRSRIHHLRGNLYFARGDGESCRREHEIALTFARQTGDVELEAQALSGLGDAEYLQARMLTGVQYFRRCVELSDGAGLVKVSIPNRCMVAHCSYYANDLAGGLVEMRRALADAQRVGQAQAVIFAYESQALLLGASGDYASAQAAIVAGIPLARAAGARRYLSIMLWVSALVQLSQGNRDRAVAELEEALALARQTGMAFAGPIILSGFAYASDDPTQARRFLDKGEAVLEEPCLSHCHLHFYRYAIDVCVRWQQWEQVLRYAARLEHFVGQQALPWASLVLQRARALVAAGSNGLDQPLIDELRRIRDRLAECGMRSTLAELDERLTGS